MVPGRTMIGILGSIWTNISLSIWTTRFLSWSNQVLFGSFRYWIESSICDNLKHEKRCSEVLFFLECTQQKQTWKSTYRLVQIAHHNKTKLKMNTRTTKCQTKTLRQANTGSEKNCIYMNSVGRNAPMKNSKWWLTNSRRYQKIIQQICNQQYE